MCRYLFIVCSIIFSSYITFSQVSQQWVARYNGTQNDNDIAIDCAIDTNGNIYVTGQSVDIPYTDFFTTVKYNSDGTQAWVRKLAGVQGSSTCGNAITVGTDGNIYVAGMLNDYCFTIKYSPNGTTLWSNNFNYAIGWGIALDQLNNVYVAGYVDSSGNNPDFLLIKYNTNGNFIWSRSYNGPGNNLDIATLVKTDASNNVYISGDSYNGNNYLTSDNATLKYFPNGTLAWIRRYDGPGHSLDETYAMDVSSGGYVCVVGNAVNANNSSDLMTILYNTAGNTVWINLYNGPGNAYDGAWAVKIGQSGKIYVTGFSAATNIEWDFDYVIIRYDLSGNQDWVQRYNGAGNSTDMATAITLDNYENVYVFGTTWSGTNYDLTTVKYYNNGNFAWVQSYSSPVNSGDNQARQIVFYPPNNIFIVGATMQNNVQLDYTTIKYSQLVGFHTISNEIPKQFSLSQNYSNPFNPTTTIKFDIPAGTRLGMFTQLKIFDILGREVAILVNEQLKPGSYEVEWDASNYPSGIYFYKLTAERFTETKKMILLK